MGPLGIVFILGVVVREGLPLDRGQPLRLKILIAGGEVSIAEETAVGAQRTRVGATQHQVLLFVYQCRFLARRRTP